VSCDITLVEVRSIFLLSDEPVFIASAFMFQEKAKERLMKEELERELHDKDRALQELLSKHQEVS
jgi:hypothetical protein